MEDGAREALAQRLSDMPLRKAMREMRKIDPDANMVYWRNSMWDEFQTLFLLPNESIEVMLVEKKSTGNSKRTIGGGPTGTKAQSTDFEYVGARVQPLDRPARKRGGTGPSPFKRAARQG